MGFRQLVHGPNRGVPIEGGLGVTQGVEQQEQQMQHCQHAADISHLSA